MISPLTRAMPPGQVLFDTLCATCHRLRSRAHAVDGPRHDRRQTGTVARRCHPRSGLRAVESRYRGWNITITDDTPVAGVIATETTNNLVLRLPGGDERPVLRKDIKAMEAIPSSLMPTGFESALPPAAMADLLRYVQGDR